MDVAPNATRHSRDDVAAAALRILDQHGLPDLTMRRLATELGVQPSALYWHFPNKQTLLAEVADRIVARVSGDPQGIEGAALALRDALLAYRDGAEVVSSSFALGLGATAARDRLAEATGDPRAATALLHFVLGHVSHEQQRLQYGSAGVEFAQTPEVGTSDFLFGVRLFAAGLETRGSGSASGSAERVAL